LAIATSSSDVRTQMRMAMAFVVGADFSRKLHHPLGR
jgi:hypothetical protein